jgi:hypothetical protein
MAEREHQLDTGSDDEQSSAAGALKRWGVTEETVDGWIAEQLRRDPHLFDDVRLEQLRPDLFPADRVLARIAIVRDRLRGIEHPGWEQRLTARL